MNRGWAWHRKREYDNSVADYSEAIRLNPNNAKAYSGRGIVFGDKGDLDKAIADFTESIRLDGMSPEGYYNRGNT